MAYSLTDKDGNSITLGNVYRESSKASGNISVFPLPTFDSSNAQAFDFGGASLIIDISGRLSGTPATVTANAKTILDLARNGDQQTVASYTSDVLGTINVKIMEASGTYDAESTGPSIFDYRIKLVECDPDTS